MKTKKFKGIDYVRGAKTRTFHSGERVRYLDWWGTVTETGTVRLDISITTIAEYLTA